MHMVTDASPPDLRRATLSELLELQAVSARAIAGFKSNSDAVKAELAHRYGESARRVLEQQGKDHGSGSLPLQDGFTAQYKVDQEVKWDSDKLMAIAQTLPWERVSALFKIVFSMPEAIYKGVSAVDPELAAKVNDARTTKIKPPAITLAKEEA